MYLNDWHRLIRKHFVDQVYQIIVPERGWGEREMKRLAVRLDPHRSVWRAAHLLGGTLAASCRKEGKAPDLRYSPANFETALRCPDCHAGLMRDSADTLVCQCGYTAPNEGGVFNLLRAADRAELYPGDREDAIDFSLPKHAARLLDGWYEVEGLYGNKYRWIGPRASAKLRRLRPGPQRLRVRGHAPEIAFLRGESVRVEIAVNGQRVARQAIDRPGLFVIEADLPDAPDYAIDIAASPSFRPPGDSRLLTLILSMIRLIPRGD